MAAARSVSVLCRMGSTVLMRKGSMMVLYFTGASGGGSGLDGRSLGARTAPAQPTSAAARAGVAHGGGPRRPVQHGLRERAQHLGPVRLHVLSGQPGQLLRFARRAVERLDGVARGAVLRQALY